MYPSNTYRAMMTPSIVIAAITKHLSEDKELQNKLRNDRSLLPAAIEEFIMDRENISSHLGFGRGRHRCVGMVLARMMLRIYLETLLDKTKDFEVDGEVHYARLPELGVRSCPIKFIV